MKRYEPDVRDIRLRLSMDELVMKFVSRSDDDLFAMIGHQAVKSAPDSFAVWLGYEILTNSKYLPQKYAVGGRR